MIAASRPLRFVVLLLGGWVAMRTAQLWPVSAPIPALISGVVAAVAPSARAVPSARPSVAPWFPTRVTRPSETGRIRWPADRSPAEAATSPIAAAPVPFAAFVRPVGTVPMLIDTPIGSPLPTARRRPSRLRGSAWGIVRSGGAAMPFASQLGGSQAGVRLTYAIDDARRLSIAARVSGALGARQREAAIGIDWQPTALPIHLIAEQRIGIEDARGGPSVGVIAGVGPVPLAAGFRLDAYGQAGMIARDGGVEGYTDAAARIARPVATIGPATIDLGLGAWGGAQRGATRLDVGPSASVAVPVGPTTLRIALDWRQRVAGNARPASGPALSLGTDF